MKERKKQIAHAFVIIGTFGLLGNEFILDWGRAATLLFAAFNLIGLVVLVIACCKRQE